ncbi:MAG: dch [Acidobacteriaceae bacterium]|nr:dch [Acidobacteriaceae bacterium]
MATQTVSKFDRLALELRGHVAHITLRHAPLNVIDIPLMEDMATALAEIEAQPEISIVVFRGEGNCFSAGVDVAAHTPDKVASMLEKFHHVIRSLIAINKVTIAEVEGHCLGGGAEIAMVCDLVYTTEDAQWGFPEIQLGCFPPVAATALSALIGQKRASDLILTGRTITGSEAAGIGLATSALATNQLATAVDETIEKLSALSPSSLELTKKAIYAWDSIHFDKGLARAEKIYLDELMKTEDAREGIRAFMEKRKPQWKGR